MYILHREREEFRMENGDNKNAKNIVHDTNINFRNFLAMVFKEQD